MVERQLDCYFPLPEAKRSDNALQDIASYYRSAFQSIRRLRYASFALAVILTAFSSLAVGQSDTIPATRGYVVPLSYSDCTQNFTEQPSFSTLDAAGQYTASKLLSAINCSLGQFWHYDYLYAQRLDSLDIF